MTKLLAVGAALGFLFILSASENAEARTVFSLQLGGPTYVAPYPYYVSPYPYYVPAPTYIAPPVYYPQRCIEVPHYTPWGVIYRTECY